MTKFEEFVSSEELSFRKNSFYNFDSWWAQMRKDYLGRIIPEMTLPDKNVLCTGGLQYIIFSQHQGQLQINWMFRNLNAQTATVKFTSLKETYETF